MLDTERYLKRIDYSGTNKPSLETLRLLHWNHLHTVPFENLDIHVGAPIRLDIDALFVKIVLKNRGGFCYELNGLFCALLRELGFSVSMLSARVADSEGALGRDFDHMILLVDMEERWLVDVGFGDSFLYPLQLDDPTPQSDGHVSYRIDRDDNKWSLYAHDKLSDKWQIQHMFTLTPYNFVDFEDACMYQQTSPQSHFVHRIICTLPTATGRVTLSDRRLIIRKHGQREEIPLEDETDVSKALSKYFNIIL